jgi:hypothetical protein
MSNEKTLPQGATQAAAGQPDKANGTEVVTVGCKLPNGLICELGKPGDENYTSVRLNGANSARVVGGYGITPHVSASFWNAWMKKNKGLSFVRAGLVFSHTDEASAADHAKDNAERRSGLEALDPMKKLVGADGKVLVETDLNHFNQGRADVAQFGGGRRATG